MSPWRCIYKKSLSKRNFKVGSLIFKLKFTQKRRIFRSYCSRFKKIEATSSPKDIINPKPIPIRKTLPDYEELDFMLRCCFFVRIYRAWNRYKTKRTKKLAPCGRLKDACNFLHTHATGDREDNLEMKWKYDKKFSSGSKHPLQYRQCKTQADGKSLKSRSQSCA